VFGVELERLDEARTPAWEGHVPWLRVLKLPAGYQRDHAPHADATLLSLVPELEITIHDEYAQLDWLWQRGDDIPLQRLVVDGRHIVGSGFADRLVHMPWVEHLQSLGLATRFVDYDSGYYDDPTLRLEGAQLIANAKFLELTALAIDRQRVTSEGLAALLASLPTLRELTARGCELKSIAALRTTVGDPIVRLDLGANAIGNDGARVLGESLRTAQLERLDLDTCEIGPAGLAHIVESPAWHTLRHLDLSRNPLGERGASTLAGAPRPARLHTLALVDVDFEPPATHEVAAIPWVRELLALDLSRNAMDDGEAFARLASGSLKQLALERVGLGPESAAALAPLWSKLVHLELGTNALYDVGLAALVGSDESPLHTLGLAWCSLGDVGFAKLADAPCPRLRRLSLAGNRPSLEGLARLIASPLLGHLELLDLSRCELPAEAAQLIASAPELARLTTLDLRQNHAIGEAELLVLAASPFLRAIRELKVPGEPWRYKQPVRSQLEQRFGVNWPYRWSHDEEDDEEDNAEDE